MKLLLLLGLLLPVFAAAQNDFIILKKKDRTIRHYYAGTQIEFVATNGAYRNALISQIKNDSLYLQEFYVLRVPTTLGTYILDTAGSFRYVYRYTDIVSFGPKVHKGFNIAGSGTALMSGALLLSVASGISYLVDKEKFSPGLLGASLALGGIGYLMNKSAAKPINIGRKYKLQYIKTTE